MARTRRDQPQKPAPKMVLHKRSGRARVRLDGRDYYLGPWGSDEAHAAYVRTIAEWRARDGAGPDNPGDDFTVDDLVIRYSEWCLDRVAAKKLHPRRWSGIMKAALSRLVALYGNTPAEKFNATKLGVVRKTAERERWVNDVDAAAAMGLDVDDLRAVVADERERRDKHGDLCGLFRDARENPGPGGRAWYVLPGDDIRAYAASIGRTLSPGMKERRLSNEYLNMLTAIQRRVFAWGAVQRFVSEEVAIKLRLLPTLDTWSKDPVPADDADVAATVRYLPPVLRDLVAVQRLTGMRPGEACAMTWGQITQGDGLLVYRPKQHKNLHRGKVRQVAIGPKAMAVLMKYRNRHDDAAIFSPREALEQVRASRRAARTSKVTESQKARDAERAQHPLRIVGDFYSTSAYGLAVRRACSRAGVEAWSPNQLRKAKATELVRSGDGAAVQGTLGHASGEMAAAYTQQHAVFEKACEAALKTG